MHGDLNWDDLNFEKSYDKYKAYCQSKLANVLHANELAKRLKDDGIIVASLHPGITLEMASLISVPLRWIEIQLSYPELIV